MVVDGKPHVARDVRVWDCPACGERLLHFKDWKLAAAKIRDRYSGQFRLRLDSELHAKLAQVAEEDQRSLNQEVVYLIKEALRALGRD